MNIPGTRIDIGAKAVQVSNSAKPHIQAHKVADLPQEEQAKVRAHLAETNARLVEHNRKMADMEKRLQDMRTGGEIQSRHAPNVADLTKHQAQYWIEHMSEQIQSGEAENVPFSSGNGMQITTNARQYVYWLQQHVKALDGAGQSTLAQA